MPWVNAATLEGAVVEWTIEGEGSLEPWSPIEDPIPYGGTLEVLEGGCVQYTSDPEGQVGNLYIRVRVPSMIEANGARATVSQLGFTQNALYSMELTLGFHPPDGVLGEAAVLEVPAGGGGTSYDETDPSPNPYTASEFAVDEAPEGEEDQAYHYAYFTPLPFFTAPLVLCFEYDLDAVPCQDITGFNCEPFPENDYGTLAEYRQKMLVRAGFAANASTPPPGVAALFNTFLQDAQTFLYRKYPALHTRWFFRWTMEEDVRFYGIRDSDGVTGDCSVIFDPYKNIEGAWCVDQNGTWFPMVCGIPPSFYTTVQNPSLPLRYEIRQCIEVFPAPSAAGYELYIKGHFGLQSFTEDTDKPTIDGELVYLWALANALDYYGKPSAAGIAQQARDYLGQLIAGTHTGKRYIPGARPIPPAIMPVLAPPVE